MGKKDRVNFGDRNWELHPDGQGIRPIKPTERGFIEIPCPECHARFIREGTDALIAKSVTKCRECHAVFLGDDVKLVDPAKKPPSKRSDEGLTK